jgi:hypothetical protein
VGGGAEERVSVQVQQVMGVSWSQSATYEDVSILMPIGGDCGIDGRSVCGSIYLTNAVGPDTTMENLLARVNLFGQPSGMNTIFTGLTLPPGTYYLMLYNASIETAPYWSSTSNPQISLAEGVMLNQAFASAILNANSNFPPASPVAPLNANLQFLVTSGPTTNVPEPSPAIPAAVGSLMLLLGSRKLSCLRRSG